MSPLNAPVATAQTTNIEQSVVEEKPLIVIATYNYENATPKKETCYMEFLGKSINDEEAEKLRLNFIEERSNYSLNTKDGTSRKYNYQHYTVIDINELETKTITYKENGQVKTRTEYYAGGAGHTYNTTGNYSDTNEPLSGTLKITKYPYLRKRIVQEFYHDLKEMLGNDVQYKKTFETE